MEKIKILIIVFLGIVSFIYLIGNNNFSELHCQNDIIVLLQGQIPVKSSDSYFGICFDYIIAFIFNVNIRDLKSYFQMFGG